MAYDINDTMTMLAALKQTYTPSSFLLDLFFPKVTPPFLTQEVDMEYKKGNRRMAPFATPGARGINSARGTSIIRRYKPPMIKTRREISAEDVSKRGFGEALFYSEMTPAEREVRTRAEDLAELQAEIARRMEWMAAQVLVYGEFEARGFADDGKDQVIDTITFDGWEQKLTLSGDDMWSNPTADILGVLDDTSQKIAKTTGILPTVMIVGKNGMPYILSNKSLYEKLLIPNAANLKLMSFQPHYLSPEVRFVGRIEFMNLDIYQYFGSYDEDGVNKPFIPDNTAVFGVPKRGRQLYGAISLVKGKERVTYSARVVPKVTADEESDTTALSLYSRPVVVPEYIDDWYTINFAQ